jgi:hypothetical protein
MMEAGRNEAAGRNAYLAGLHAARALIVGAQRKSAAARRFNQLKLLIRDAAA